MKLEEATIKEDVGTSSRMSISIEEQFLFYFIYFDKLYRRAINASLICKDCFQVEVLQGKDDDETWQ